MFNVVKMRFLSVSELLNTINYWTMYWRKKQQHNLRELSRFMCIMYILMSSQVVTYTTMLRSLKGAHAFFLVFVTNKLPH